MKAKVATAHAAIFWVATVTATGAILESESRPGFVGSAIIDRMVQTKATGDVFAESAFVARARKVATLKGKYRDRLPSSDAYLRMRESDERD